MEDLDQVNSSGASTVIAKDLFRSSRFKLNTSGASDIELHIETESIDINASGSSDIELSGEVGNMTANLSGASDLDADDFKADVINIMTGGGSNADIYAKSSLVVNAYGGSNIDCKGDPGKREVKTSGGGQVDID